jgi:hypothetical protein
MNGEDIKKYTPFSTYDFLGYLIPGSTFIATGYFFDRWLLVVTPNRQVFVLFSEFASIINNVSSKDNNNVFTSIIAIILVFIVCYTVGHLLATLSSFFIDRYLIKSGFRYPLVNFLNPTKNNQVVPPERIFKTRARCSLVVLYVIIVVVTQLFFISNTMTLVDYIYWFISITVIIFLFFMFYFPSKLVRTLSYFPTWFGGLIERHLDMSGQMDDSFGEKIVAKVKEDFHIDLTDASQPKGFSNAYWLMFIKVGESSNMSHSMLVNWLHLYSYARNTSTSFFVIALYIMGTVLVNGENMYQLDKRFYFLYGFLFGGALLASLVLLVRYYYLFSSYYTKYLLRAYYYVSTQSKSVKND